MVVSEKTSEFRGEQEAKERMNNSEAQKLQRRLVSDGQFSRKMTALIKRGDV